MKITFSRRGDKGIIVKGQCPIAEYRELYEFFSAFEKKVRKYRSVKYSNVLKISDPNCCMSLELIFSTVKKCENFINKELRK